MLTRRNIGLCLLAGPLLMAEVIVGYRGAAPLSLPGAADSNSPVVWWKGRMVAFTSDGVARRSEGARLEDLSGLEETRWEGPTRSRWIEAAWVDSDDTMYVWFHSEPSGICSNSLTAPVIGAGVSVDGGRTFRDLGIILEAGDAPNCNALNGFFASGHGDFSVVPDRAGEYFYFYFGNYGGPASGQGIAMARLPMAARAQPVGEVWKYFQGEWTEPGLKGRVTPVFPVDQPWDASNTSAFWGPSLHYNTYLQRYVILMNRACCAPGWPQEGVYLTTNPDIADPQGWSTPVAILSNLDHFAWYPSVVGMGPGETDSLAGDTMRFLMRGHSSLELVFWNGTLEPDEEAHDAGHSDNVRKLSPGRR